MPYTRLNSLAYGHKNVDYTCMLKLLLLASQLLLTTVTDIIIIYNSHKKGLFA